MCFCAGAREVSAALANTRVINFNSLIDCCVFTARAQLRCHRAVTVPVWHSHAFAPFHPKNPTPGGSRAHCGEGTAIAAPARWPLRAGGLVGTCRQQPLAGRMDGFSLCGFVTLEEVWTRQEGKRCGVPLSRTFLQALTYP